MPRVPFVMQQDAADCGPACLVMLSQHFGRPASIAVVRDLSGTDRRSSSLSGLVRAASTIGLSAVAVKAENGVLPSDTPLPAVLHLRTSTGGHFVVLEKQGGRTVRIVDPARGRKTIAASELRELWTGYLLLVTAAVDWDPQDSGQPLLRRFLPTVLMHRGPLVLAVVASLLLVLLGLAGASYVRLLVDEVLFTESTRSLHFLSVGFGLISIVRVLVAATREHLVVLVGLKIDAAVTVSFLRHMLSLPQRFFDSRKVGDIVSRVFDVSRLRDVLTGSAVTVFFDSTMLVVAATVLMAVSLRLFAVVVPVLVGTAAIIFVFRRTFRERYRHTIEAKAEFQSGLVEAVESVLAIKASRAEPDFSQRLEARVLRSVWPILSASRLEIVQGTLSALLDGLGFVAVFWVGGTLILRNTLSLGQLLSFSVVVGYFLGPVQRLIALQPAIQQGIQAAVRVAEVLDLETEPRESERLIRCSDVTNAIEFRNVSFRYGVESLALSDVSFLAPAGSIVGIVGGSGSGKSTLVKLLLRLYDPIGGSILFDSVDTHDISPESLRGIIGYVPQDVFLVCGTVYENIAMGHPGATLNDVIEVSRLSGADAFIERLPNRYFSEISERGVSLSGGERQRIAIARALMGSPRVMVFDEATRNLDPILETALYESIERVAGSRVTQFIVTHRVNQLHRCDLICVLENGSLVEFGTPARLMEEDGAFATLMRSVQT